MMNTYKKPVVTVDAGMAEGVYGTDGGRMVVKALQWQTGLI